jgi:large subunit ribosomal protein L21
MYAVIENGSKQYRVAEGDVIEVEKLSAKVGDKVQIDRVLMVGGNSVKVGTPTVDGAKVTATVEGHGRGDKIIVYKHKKNYHKKQGHRQDFTRLRIDKITAKAKAKAKPKAEAEDKPKAETKAKPKAKAEAKPKTETKAKAKPKAKAKAEESTDGS